MAYWRLDEDDVGIVKDFTNHGWTGLYMDDPADSVPGGSTDGNLAAEFEGGDRINTWLSQVSHIYHPTGEAPGDGMTVEIWHYRPVSIGDGPKDMGLIGSWDGASGGGIMLWISFFSAQYSMTLSSDSGTYLNSGDIPQLGTWEHIVGVFEQTGPTTGLQSLYVNGELVASASRNPSTTLGQGDVFNIGTYNNSAGTVLAGWLDEGAVYQYPLTAEQILAHYNVYTAGAVAIEYEDAATVTLSLAPVAAFPYGQPILDNFNRAASSSLGSNWIPLVTTDGRWDVLDGEMYESIGGWINDVWATEFADQDLFVWAEISQIGSGTAHLWIVQEPNTTQPDGYGFHFNADFMAFYRMDNNTSSTFVVGTDTVDLAVGDCVGFSMQQGLLKAYYKPAGSDTWREVIRGVPLQLGVGETGGHYHTTYVGIGQEPQATTWKFTNFGGGSIPSVIELDSLHSVESATIGLLLTPSATEEYETVTGTEYTDAATATLSLTVAAIEGLETTDTATVALALQPGVALAFPTVGVIDDFNRGSIGANWPVFPFGANSMVLTGNQLVSASADFRGNYYAPAQFGPDQEAFITLVDFPTAFAFKGVHLYLRVQTPDISATDGYKLHFLYVNGSVSHWGMERITDGASGGFVAYGDDVTPIYADGDIVGARIVGNTITMYRFRNGVWQVLGSATDSPYVGAGYVALSTDDAGTIDNFGAGTRVVAPDTFHGVDSATISLLLTPSAVEEHTITDRATVALTFTVNNTNTRSRRCHHCHHPSYRNVA